MTRRPFVRTATRAVVSSLALALLCVLASVALVVAAQPREPVSSVEVVDDASVLDPGLVAEDVGQIDFHSPVRVVVWTRDGEYEDNLNAETLEWARDNPDMGLLSADGRYWADGLLLITVSVESNDVEGSGQAGTYYGEDVKIASEGTQERTQESGYSDFQARDWSAGVTAIAEASSGEMARPAWTRGAVTIGLPAAALILCLLNAGAVRYMRTRYQALCGDFDRATAGVHERVTSAEFVLDDGLGARIRQTAGSVLREYDDTLTLRGEIDALSLWKVNAANAGLWSGLKRFKENTTDIREASAMLERATSLYHRDGSWEEVWEQEIRETAEQLEAARDDRMIAANAGPEAAAELAAFSRQALSRLEDIRRRGIAGDGENIVSCLDEIATIRTELSSRMNAIERKAMPADPSRSSHISRAIAKERRSRNRGFGSITGYYDRSTFYSPLTFTLGYRAGVASHRRAQQVKKSMSSSGSGRTTGYGSRGGGFRGSGSSSRF